MFRQLPQWQVELLWRLYFQAVKWATRWRCSSPSGYTNVHIKILSEKTNDFFGSGRSTFHRFINLQLDFLNDPIFLCLSNVLKRDVCPPSENDPRPFNFVFSLFWLLFPTSVIRDALDLLKIHPEATIKLKPECPRTKTAFVKKE